MVNSPPRILVMGFRKGLIKALRKRGLEFSLWNEKPVPAKFSPPQTLISEYPLDPVELESRIADWGNFSHVISGVESAVYPASLIRRPLKARMSKDSVILRCHDKLKMKQYLTEFDVPMTDFIEGDSPLSGSEIFERLGTPLVVKSRKLSGGRGMRLLHSPSELEDIRKPHHIFEHFIVGTESSVESFVHQGQIRFQNITYYRTPGFTNLLPSHQQLSASSEIQKLNEKVLSSLGIQWGMSHMEVYNTSLGPIFGEIALRPPGGYLMELLELSYGFNAWEAFLAVELGDEFHFPAKTQAWSASMILHPGEGHLQNIHGLETIKSLESLSRIKLGKDLHGKFITARKGVGEEIGHILLSNPDQHRLLNDLEICERELRFEKRSEI